MKTFICLLLLSTAAFAGNKIDGLTAEDQKYYKNDIREGMNAVERTDSLVREVNKMHGEMASMKAEIQSLRREVEELKNHLNTKEVRLWLQGVWNSLCLR